MNQDRSFQDNVFEKKMTKNTRDFTSSDTPRKYRGRIDDRGAGRLASAVITRLSCVTPGPLVSPRGGCRGRPPSSRWLLDEGLTGSHGGLRLEGDRGVGFQGSVELRAIVIPREQQ